VPLYFAVATPAGVRPDIEARAALGGVQKAWRSGLKVRPWKGLDTQLDHRGIETQQLYLEAKSDRTVMADILTY
jgi:hypothetical protein